MTLEQLLQEIRRRRVLLLPSRNGRIVPWSPHTRLAREVRAAIAAHNRELARLINRSDPRLCTNPDLHRWSWSYQNRRYCCDICAHLLPCVRMDDKISA